MKQEIKNILTNEFIHSRNREEHVNHATDEICKLIKDNWREFTMKMLSEGVEIFGIKGGGSI